jgi:tetratricopeptide (TPR) repeat protein
MKFKLIVLSVLVVAIALLYLGSCQSPELTSAKVYFQQNNIDAAEEQLLKALQNEPSNPEVPFLLAVGVYIPRKDWISARQYLLKANEINPSYINPSTRTTAIEQLKQVWGEVHSEGANKFNAAIKAILPIEKDSLLKDAAKKFQLAIEIKDDEVLTYNGLIKCYTLMEDTASVIEWAEKFKERNLFDEEVFVFYAQMLWGRGEKDKAINELDSIMNKHPESLKLQELRIQFLAQSNRVDEAKEIGNKLIADNPDNIEIKYLMAQIFSIMQDYETAQYYFNQVLIENPDDIEVLTRVAETAFRAQDWISAEDYSRKIIALDPENAYGYTLLWKALYNQGKKDEAEKYRAIEKSLQ